MCELPGANADTPTDVMFSFADLARRGVECANGFRMAFAQGQSRWPFIDAQSAAGAPAA